MQKRVIVDIILCVVFAYMLIVSGLGIFGYISFEMFKKIAAHTLWVFYVASLIAILFYNYKRPRAIIPNKIENFVENLFSAFLVAAILFTFFWRSNGILIDLWLLTFLCLIMWVAAKINSKRRKEKWNIKLWFIEFVSVLTPTLIATVLITGVTKRLSPLPTTILFFIIIVLVRIWLKK